MASNNNIKIRIASKLDHSDIVKGFHNWYWPDEPLSIGFEIKTPSAIEEETFTTIPEKGLSLLATTTLQQQQDDTDADTIAEKSIGFLINGLNYPTLINELQEKFQNSNCKRMDALINVMDTIDKKVNIFEKYEIDKAFHFLCVAVDPEWRGKAIGIKLFQHGFQMAKSLGFKIVSVDCTSVYSITIAERCGMICIAELEYANYIDSDGNQIFKPPAPHTHMKRFIKIL